jgi:hypothetical protein
MATDTDKSVLDIDTVVERLHVRIDGVPHQLSHPNALSLRNHIRMEKIGPRMSALLMASSENALTDDAEAELQGLLDEGCRLVLEAPPVVHAKLRDKHRVAILQVFMQLQSHAVMTGALRVMKARKRTGGRSSRASSASTRAALQPTG